MVAGDVPENLDLKELTEELRQKLKPGEPVGYLRGRSADAGRGVPRIPRPIAARGGGLDGTTLELQGYLHFLGNPSERSHADSHWDIEP